MPSEQQSNLLDYEGLTPRVQAEMLTSDTNVGFHEGTVPWTPEEGRAHAEAVARAAVEDAHLRELEHPRHPTPQEEVHEVSMVGNHLADLRLWEQEMLEGEDAHAFRVVAAKFEQRTRTADDFARITREFGRRSSNDTTTDYEPTGLTDSRR